MISSDFVKNLWSKWRFNVSLMLFVTVDTPDPYLILRIKTAPEGRRRTKTKDNEVNPVWNEEFTFFLDGAVDNKLRMFTNPRQIVFHHYFSSRISVFSVCMEFLVWKKGEGGGYLRRLHCTITGQSFIYVCIYNSPSQGEKKEKTLSFRKIGHVCVVYIGAWMIYCSMHCVCIMMLKLVVQ